MNLRGRLSLATTKATASPRYSNSNTQSRAENTINSNVSTYSYGNYYTWHAAIADTTNYTSGTHNTTSICPKGWSMPAGNTTTAGYGKPDISIGGTGANQSTAAAYNKWRKYPNNFLYSGVFINSSVNVRGSSSLYWSSTVNGTFNSYNLVLGGTAVYPGTYSYNKYYGISARCLATQ